MEENKDRADIWQGVTLDGANLKAGKPRIIGATVNGVEHVMIPKALYDEWIAADDAALDWADANVRWFDISTAPKDGTLVMFHVPSRTNPLIGRADDYWAGAYWLADVTHWTHLPPPPSNPPLPEPLERLGEILRRIKRVS